MGRRSGACSAIGSSRWSRSSASTPPRRATASTSPTCSTWRDRGRTVLFGVQPKFTNVDIRITVDVTFGAVDLFVSPAYDTFARGRGPGHGGARRAGAGAGGGRGGAQRHGPAPAAGGAPPRAHHLPDGAGAAGRVGGAEACGGPRWW
ncbi:unnamed protein product [Eretmochelys imbricata]